MSLHNGMWIIINSHHFSSWVRAMECQRKIIENFHFTVRKNEAPKDDVTWPKWHVAGRKSAAITWHSQSGTASSVRCCLLAPRPLCPTVTQLPPSLGEAHASWTCWAFPNRKHSWTMNMKKLDRRTRRDHEAHTSFLNPSPTYPLRVKNCLVFPSPGPCPVGLEELQQRRKEEKDDFSQLEF